MAGKKKLVLLVEKKHNQKRAPSKIVAKTIGDKRKYWKTPEKTRFFADPAFHEDASDKLPKNSRENFGQHFPLQNYKT